MSKANTQANGIWKLMSKNSDQLIIIMIKCECDKSKVSSHPLLFGVLNHYIQNFLNEMSSITPSYI